MGQYIANALPHGRVIVVTDRNAIRQHTRAIRRCPPEQIRRQRFFIRLRTHEDVILQAFEFKNLRQGSRMPEGIGIVGNPRRTPQ